MLIQVDTDKLLRLLKSLGFIGDTPQLATPVIFIGHGEGELSMASVTVLDTQADFSATVNFLDARGNPTEPDDVPAWASSDESVATVAASDDGKSATVTITGGLGATVISCDSNNQEGTDIHAEGTVTVQASDAVTSEITFSVPDQAGTGGTGTTGDTGTTPPDTGGTV